MPDRHRCYVAWLSGLPCTGLRLRESARMDLEVSHRSARVDRMVVTP